MAFGVFLLVFHSHRPLVGRSVGRSLVRAAAQINVVSRRTLFDDVVVHACMHACAGRYCFLVFLYFTFFEAFPSATVLWNQRRLPPKLNSDFSSVGDLGLGVGDLTDSLTTN